VPKKKKVKKKITKYDYVRKGKPVSIKEDFPRDYWMVECTPEERKAIMNGKSKQLIQHNGDDDWESKVNEIAGLSEAKRKSMREELDYLTKLLGEAESKAKELKKKKDPLEKLTIPQLKMKIEELTGKWPSGNKSKLIELYKEAIEQEQEEIVESFTEAEKEDLTKALVEIQKKPKTEKTKEAKINFIVDNKHSDYITDKRLKDMDEEQLSDLEKLIISQNELKKTKYNSKERHEQLEAQKELALRVYKRWLIDDIDVNRFLKYSNKMGYDPNKLTLEIAELASDTMFKTPSDVFEDMESAMKEFDEYKRYYGARQMRETFGDNKPSWGVVKSLVSSSDWLTMDIDDIMGEADIQYLEGMQE